MHYSRLHGFYGLSFAASASQSQEDGKRSNDVDIIGFEIASAAALDVCPLMHPPHGVLAHAPSASVACCPAMWGGREGVGLP